jgi:hypothetical protein
MSKHTPGPWIVTPQINRVSHRNPLGGIRAVATAHVAWFVADDGSLHKSGRDSDAISENEAIANAALIAAAPELLEALKEVSEETRHRDYDWTVDLAQRVRAAIARAEGKV